MRPLLSGLSAKWGTARTHPRWSCPARHSLPHRNSIHGSTPCKAAPGAAMAGVCLSCCSKSGGDGRPRPENTTRSLALALQQPLTPANVIALRLVVAFPAQVALPPQPPVPAHSFIISPSHDPCPTLGLTRSAFPTHKSHNLSRFLAPLTSPPVKRHPIALCCSWVAHKGHHQAQQPGILPHVHVCVSEISACLLACCCAPSAPSRAITRHNHISRPVPS